MIERPTLFVWPGRLLYVGPGQDTDDHAHHAHQVTVAVQGSVRFEFADHAPLAESALLIPAMCRHRQKAGGAWVASLYLDPRAFDRIASLGARPRVLGSSLGAAFQHAATWDATTARAATDELVTTIRGDGRPPRPRHDPRAARVIQIVRQEIAGSTGPSSATSARFASTLGLSVSRFTHLFSESVGMPFRTYVLWLRLESALDSLAARSSVTQAAHAAGFADAAHLSRTFHRMFGVAPSEALGHVRFVREGDP